MHGKRLRFVIAFNKRLPLFAIGLVAPCEFRMLLWFVDIGIYYEY
jgi:hypothetical protein